MDIVDAIIPAPNNSHDVIQLLPGDDIVPVDAQGVGLDDIDIALERQEIEAHVHDVLRPLHHLALGDPQRGLGDGGGEVVDLDAVELADGHLDGVHGDAHADLAALQQVDHLVLQPAQAEVALGEEIAATRRGVCNQCNFDTKKGPICVEIGHFQHVGHLPLCDSGRRLIIVPYTIALTNNTFWYRVFVLASFGLRCHPPRRSNCACLKLTIFLSVSLSSSVTFPMRSGALGSCSAQPRFALAALLLA